MRSIEIIAVGKFRCDETGATGIIIIHTGIIRSDTLNINNNNGIR